MSKHFILTLSAALCLTTAHAQLAGSYVSRTIAGVFPLGDGGPATSAILETPQAVVADSSGTIYIADAGNGVIRKVSRGIISTVAGYTGYISDLKLDSSGNLYLAGGNNVFKLTSAGKVTTVAGNGTSGTYTGDGGPAINAGFSGAYAIALDSTGNLYICDSGNNAIRKVTPDGIIRTIAGGKGKGFAGDNGPASAAALNYPRHIALDGAGNIYINDYNNNRIRKIALDGTITTIAGNNICCNIQDGAPATNVYLVTGPVTTDSLGNVYVYDIVTSRIRVIAPNGIIQAFAGDGTEGFAGDGSSATLAHFSGVTGLGMDPNNNLYVVDGNNERVRMINSVGSIATVAGRAHFSGDGGAATAATLHRPQGTVTGTDGSIYFTDTANHRVRKIGTDGKITTIAGTGDLGFSGDGGPATQATMSFPDALAIDSTNNLYVIDQKQLRVRKITPTGTISTVAGNGTLAYSTDTRGALQSGFAYLTGIAVDSSGNLYLSENLYNKIKKVTPAGSMSTYAGTGGAPIGTPAFSGDGQAATQAGFGYPSALTVDKGGNLYITDSIGTRIRKVDATTGIVTTIAGTGGCCYSGDEGKATSARIDPYGLTVDAAGGIFFTDPLGIRYIRPDGSITRVSGSSSDFGFAGDDESAGPATLYNYPYGIALNSAGEIIVADTDNSRIRKLQPNDATRMDVVSGNNQTGTTGTALNPIIVKITGKAGAPAGGVNVTFAVTSGTADLSLKTVATDATGQAGITATPTKAGTLTITATAGAFTAKFTATITDPVIVPPPPPADSPVISQGGIGQNGFSVPPVQTISTGAITTIYGSNFMAAGSAVQINAVAGGQLSSKFAGVCVTVGGVRAPIFAVATTQITVAIPTLSPGAVPVQVLRNCDDSANQLKSNVITVNAQASSPEFLYLQANANGQNPVAAVSATDGAFIGTEGSIPGANLHPAKSGDILVVYALGLGATSPAQQDGVPAPGIANAALPVNVTIGGVQLAATDILYAGVSPSYIGLYQINLRVPAGVAAGNQPMLLTVGSNQSPTGGYLTVE
uniref:NHL repeat containing protein n=1 Tax=Solibacter usitatus (strain Ellin6076) TaxID=234267 RepID=Q025Z3_SOLUE